MKKAFILLKLMREVVWSNKKKLKLMVSYKIRIYALQFKIGDIEVL